ncbi:C45 family autoproteolytic acyltransferase/hydrolase [Vibrio hannami]|uniref:C45 family autoproteolytic acyltransferase/hydolase n=1 Tax=Vibrio hannami TaxID=2717094 RepID=UPI002410A639|nr:C45 family peptidase [Vibrio hannami]MDG3088043.1 C45 family autoproteolytic acyltransferase/hydrolase [Vibrio hannami]
MKTIEFDGNHYELGLRIGQLSKDIFDRHIKPSKGFEELTRWKSSDWFNEVTKLVELKCPGIFAELQGIADGASQPFEDILLWNCRGDLVNCIPEGCTSIGVTQSELTLVAHNEDGDPELKEHVFLLKARMAESTDFTSFVYPASIPGHSFAMNEHGLAFTVNNIRLTDKQVGLPRMVMSRSLLESKDFKAFISALESSTRSGAFHYTVADLTYKKALSIEAPFQKVSSIEACPVVVHANHLVHHDLDFVPQIITESSASRQIRMEELGYAYKEAFDSQVCLKILRDKHHDVLPIFRQAADDPDEENTLATAIFTFEEQGLIMNVFEPQSEEAVYTEVVKN